MTQSLIEPKRKVLYPDSGGYTGFSIFVWEVELERDWGRVRMFIMEARYYIRGVVLERNSLADENELIITTAFEHTEQRWKRKIDAVVNL